MTATPEVDSPSSASTIRNPATGAVAGQVRWTDPADVPRIAAGLRDAQKEWEARGAKGRAKVLARYAVWLGEHRDEIESLLIKETGKSAVDAAQEVPLLIMILSYYIKTMEKALAPETRPASLPFLAIKKVTVHYRPRQVVGIIAPWNYPVANALMDAIGALAAGCSVLLKPSERTPLTAEVLLRGWHDSGAPEVLALAQGAREVSEAVIDNSDFIQFTGSSATGAKVMERAARRLTPVSLELGGKDPMIVLEDADIELAAHAAVWGAMFNAGQTCVSVERVYVLEQVYDQFVSAVVRDVEKLKMGAGQGYDFGSLIDDDQVAVTERHVRDALAAGAKALTGGERTAGQGSLLPADGARRRRPLDGLHDRGDLRPDAADHEGVVGRGGGAAGQRQPVRPVRVGVLQERRARQRGCGAARLRCGQRQRRDLQPDVHHRADGRLEDLGDGRAVRRRRGPSQVLQAGGRRRAAHERRRRRQLLQQLAQGPDADEQADDPAGAAAPAPHRQVAPCAVHRSSPVGRAVDRRQEQRQEARRINAMRYVLSKFDYDNKDREVVGRPDPLIVGRAPAD